MPGWAAGGTLGNENGENMFVKYISAFAQDDWKVTPRLTLNFRLRWDLYTAPVYPDDHVSNFVLDYTNIGGSAQLPQVRPRIAATAAATTTSRTSALAIGLACRLTNKTVLRAAYGIIYGAADYVGDDTARFKNQSPDFVEYTTAANRPHADTPAPELAPVDEGTD
jgi:outer membrane receptor protein involved in Fe transport